METVYEKIISLLNTNSAQYKTFEHPPVVTSEDAARVRGTDLAKGAKAIVLFTDKKPGLFILSGNKKIDFKQIKSVLQVNDVRMATHEEVKDLTTCEVGGVPPIGTVLNLPTYLDEAFTHNETMDFNAGEREKSIEMFVKEYLAIVNPTIFSYSKD